MSSNNLNNEIDIQKVIQLARAKKYEVTSAGFAVLDKIEKINFPKKMKGRKPAVLAIHALSDKMVKYDYFTPEQRKKLLQEAGLSDTPYKSFKGLFSNTSPAYASDESEEEFIAEETSSKPPIFMEDDDFEEASDDFEEDEEEDESFEEDEED